MKSTVTGSTSKLPAAACLACLSLFFSGPSGHGQTIPASYDLRSVSTGGGIVSWTPDIQDQGLFSDCWTFASATAIDSYLLMNGLLGAPVSAPPAIQISSWHLSSRNGSPESVIGPNYSKDGQGWGGFEYQALGYLTRGQGDWAIPGVPASPVNGYITTMGGGPVFDSASGMGNKFPSVFENSTPANISDLLPVTNQTPVFQTLSVTMYDQGAGNNVPLPAPITPGGSDYNFTQGAADPQVAAVKAAITAKGAVTTSMNATDYSYFHGIPNGSGSYTINYFNPSKNPNNTDHEVTIIGWNDSYVMTDPSTNVTYTGAWLVQNSWGKGDWANVNNLFGSNDGTFWAPYDDAAIGRAGVSSFTMGNTGNYSPIVIQNELGPLGYANNYYDGQGVLGMAQDTHNTAASILTPATDGTLTAIGVASQIGGINLTIQIYSDWSNGPANLLSTQTFFMNGIGYQLVDLTSQISLTAGDSFVVELIYDTALAAVPIVIGGDGLNGYLDVPDGLSFYYDSTSSTWKDYADKTFGAYSGSTDASGGILFVKGFTAIPEPGAVGLLLLGCLLLAPRIMFKRSRGWEPCAADFEVRKKFEINLNDSKPRPSKQS